MVTSIKYQSQRREPVKLIYDNYTRICIEVFICTDENYLEFKWRTPIYLIYNNCNWILTRCTDETHFVFQTCQRENMLVVVFLCVFAPLVLCLPNRPAPCCAPKKFTAHWTTIGATVNTTIGTVNGTRQNNVSLH